MKIVFLTNYLNHHQTALTQALWEKTNGELWVLETDVMSRERIRMGCAPRETAYTLPVWENRDRAVQLIREADVVIAGSAPEKLVRKRIKTGKLLLRYSERPLKEGAEPLKYLPRLLRWHWRNPRKKPIYLLCASGYAAEDYAKFGLFRSRAYQWGYFPETVVYRDFSALMAKKDPARMVWCGRFLELKHPEDVLAAAAGLRLRGYVFAIDFIGSGALEAQLRQRVRELRLEDCVSFLGTMPPQQVRRHMEQAGIFLFTSDRREGWGAVLNEAMNSGCAVIAGDAAGAVPYLAEDGRNALVYPSRDVDGLSERMRFLLEYPEEQKRLGRAAYETITATWNGETAAARVIALAEQLLSGQPSGELFREGPCSPAERQP